MAEKEKVKEKADKYNNRMEDLILSLGSKNKQDESKNENRSAIWWIILWLVSIALFVLCTFIIVCSWFWTVLFGLSTVLLSVMVIYFGLAPRNLFYTLVEEGTAKIILKGGKFYSVIMQWKEYEFDAEWNVIKTGRTSGGILGGLRFYGLWPVYTILSKVFRWQDVQLVQGEEKLLFHEKEIDYVLVKPAIYGTDLKKAETGSSVASVGNPQGAMERIPLDVQFLVTMRVVNPYMVFFNAPPNWNEKLLARLNAVLRGYIGSHSLDEILSKKGNPEDIWNDLNTDHEFEKSVKYFKEKWGVQIEENGVDLRDIDMPSEYQEAAAAEKRLGLEAAGAASQTVGMIIASMAKSRGKSVKEIQEMIDGSDELTAQFMETAKDLLMRKMAIDAGAFADIRVGGAEGLEKTLLNLLVAAKKIGGGKNGS